LNIDTTVSAKVSTALDQIIVFRPGGPGAASRKINAGTMRPTS